MPFHAYVRPADFIYLFPQARSFIYADSDIVSGNVVLYPGYQGLVREKGSNRLDDPDLYKPVGDYQAYPDIGPLGVAWGTVGADWGVIGGLIYLSTPVSPSNATLALYLPDNGFAHNDVSVDVSTTAGVAGVTHHIQSLNTMIATYLDPVAGRVKAATVVGQGINTVLFSGTTPITNGSTYRLRVAEAANGVCSVYLNGVFEGTYNLTGVTIDIYTATNLHGVGMMMTGSTARFSNFYVAPQTVMAATNYTVRNYDGDIVYTATTASLADPAQITIPDSALKQRSNRGPYGWYRVYLTGPDHGDGQWGTAYGDAAFCRIPTRSGFPANTVINQPAVGSGVDEYARGIMALGTNRYRLSSLTSGTVAANNASVVASAPILKTYWADYATSLRPRKIIGAFPDGTQGIEATVVTPTVNLLKSSIKAWEPVNEPNFLASPASYVTNQLVPFYNAVKAADATATVVAPGTVSFNSGEIGWYTAFFAAGGGSYCDALSVHAYNCFNGDMALARRTLTSLRATMATAGFAKPIYQTEQGFGWEYAGLVYPRNAGRWTAHMWFLCELYGLPVENNFYWYDTPIGFDAFPMFWTNPTGIGPQPLPVRTMVSEIGNRTLTSQFDFGTHGNNLYAGGTWTASDGSKTVGLMAASYGQPDLLLDVTGAASLTCSDTWGNTFTLGVTNGRATFPVSEMPQWIRCPIGVSVTPADLGLITNLASAATVTSDATAGAGSQGGQSYVSLSTTDATLLNNGFQENHYEGGSAPLRVFNPVLPLTITLTWSSPQTMNRVIVHSFSPWQLHGPPAAFTVDTWDGAAWTTRYSYTKPASKTFAFTSGAARCTYETYFDEQWVFDISFLTVATSKVRIVITDALIGSGEPGTFDALWGPWDNGTPKIVTIREIQAFNVTGNVPLFTQGRNPAMGGVLR